MRISEDRYTRDLRRIHLAQRLIRHEVRTQSICAWTGLTDERIRNLCRSYDPSLAGAPRHRGPAPKRVLTLLRSPLLRCEASALGALAYALRVIPRQPLPNARRDLPGLETGERLCHAFELYRRIVPESRFAMDQFILLVLALAEGTDLEVAHCAHCHGALLLDRLGIGRRLCPFCKSSSVAASADAAPDPFATAKPGSGNAEGDPSPEPYQQSLF